MIVAKLIGGLGNQLFQYAAARSLSLHKHTGLGLDISGFGETDANTIARSYQLDSFNIDAPVITEQDRLKKTRFSYPARIRNRILPYYRRRFYNEQFFHFDPLFFKASASTTLVGYWQSEKYFKPFAGIIRNDLTFNKAISLKYKDLAANLQKKNSVSIHIRRGDYVNNPETRRMHGTCSITYYRNAVEEIRSRIGDPELFIFSDDINWVKNNFNLPYKMTVMEQPPDAIPAEDMYLMSLCSHNIIANSSFSWWAAWLNGNENKIVVAPTRWFDEFKADTKDIYPEGWIKI